MPRSIQYLLSAVVLIAVAASLIIGLRKRDTIKKPEGNVLVVISPHQDYIQSEFFKAFQTWYEKETGRTCTVQPKEISAGTQGQLRYIVELFDQQPSGIGIDIFWGGGTDPYAELKEKDLLHTYRVPENILQYIPPTCAGQPTYDPAYQWYGAAISGFGIIYNKKYQRQAKLPAPETWEDLTRPELFGKVSMADPRKSGVAHTLCEIILQAYGWEKGFEVLMKMSGNCKMIVDASSRVPGDVALGEVIYGPTIDFYAWAQIAIEGAETIGFVLPRGLTVINADAMGILKGAPNLELAEAFLRFVLSEDGQKLLILPKGVPGGPKERTIGRISVIPDLMTKYADQCVARITAADLKAGIEYDSEKASLRQGILNDLLGAILVDTHDDLAKAWGAVVVGKVKEEDKIKALVSVPVSEVELMKLAAEKWGDESFRNKTIAEWIKFATTKYRNTLLK
ncbi:MAG: ABC transporter substrate-binding protein [Planctomycetota bacterium]